MYSKLRKKILSFSYRLNSHRTTDAYLVGYPKCGNTWLRIMLGKYVQLLTGINGNLPLPLFSEFDHWGRCKRWAPSLPRIQFTHGQLSWENQTSKDMTLDNIVLPYKNKKIALLVRSIPDVIASMYAQYAHRNKPPYPGSISNFIRDPHLGVKKIITWYSLWHSGRDRVPQLQLFRYEDFKKDVSKEFQRLLTFWQIPILETSVQTAIDFASFDNMRKLEIENIQTHALVYESSGLSVFATGDISKTSDAFHVRKGKVDGYKDDLSPEDANYVFDMIHQNLPAWFGYTHPNH